MRPDVTTEHAGAGAQLSRRRLLQGAVAVAALSGCQLVSPGTERAPRSSVGTSPPVGREQAHTLAMHVHASASEGTGSLRAQLEQAAANRIDVVWFTEHDWRRRLLLYRDSYSFTPDEYALGGPWTLERVSRAGSGADGGGDFVTDPVSPNDPASSKGSLRLRATSPGDEVGTTGFRVAAEGDSRENYRTRIAARTLSVDVLLLSAGPDAWAELRLGLSEHPGHGDRPDGICSIAYRLRPDVTEKSVSTDGLRAYVDLPVAVDAWQTVTVDPTADLGLAWADLDPRDNGMHQIEFHAASRRDAHADVCFGFLRFQDRPGYDALGVERSILEGYAREVPGVTGLVGTEISLGTHVNHFGGPQRPFDYGPNLTLEHRPGDIRSPIVDFIHGQGGLACLNHPAAPTSEAGTGSSAQIIARDLLTIGAAGADLIEVGYGRSGLDALPEQLAVFDTLARNGLFLTGTGASDDHSGHNWAGQQNRFYTGAWSPTRDEAGLLDALARGRSYVGYLGSFTGRIDMEIDEQIPMGAVDVSPLTTRSLHVEVTNLPVDGSVQVIRGLVDRAGPTSPDPNSEIVNELSAMDLGSADILDIDTSDDCFYRVQVTDKDGAVVAFGQPIWLLHEEPATGVPTARRVAG